MADKKPYVYVQAYQHGENLAFRHCGVWADDDEDAYALGAETMEAMRLPFGAVPMNDYVIALERQLGVAHV